MNKQDLIVAYSFLFSIISILVLSWVAVLLGYLHWLVALTGTLGSSGIIAVIIVSIKQFKVVKK